MTGWGDENNPISKALKAGARRRLGRVCSNTKQFHNALRLFAGTYNIVCRRFGDPNILPYLHVSLVFIHHLTLHPDAMAHIAPRFPWKLTALMLNTLLESASLSSSSQAQDLLRLLDEGAPFPGSSTGKDGEQKAATRRRKPLPDDYTLRGFPWSQTYFPGDHFVIDEKIDDDDKYFEVLGMAEERRERVVWLAGLIARNGAGRGLCLDEEKKFRVHDGLWGRIRNGWRTVRR